MLDPAPTTKIADNLVRATVLAFHDATDAKPAYAVLGFANTDYEIFLEPMGDSQVLKARINKKVIGTIHMGARKLTVSGAGGQFIDPYAGVPRRVQGTVIAIDAQANRLVVNAGVSVHLTPTSPGQHATDFTVGDFVGCDLCPGAGFLIQSPDKAK